MEANVPKAEQVVQNPTYMADIRHFFDQVDIDHMAAKNIDLGSYAGVKKNALAIYAHTTQPGGDMPPDPARKWTAERSQTFRNWILAGYPIGSDTAPGAAEFAAAMPAGRVRKSVTALSRAEFDKLEAAFKGIMARDASDKTSYSALASIHGLPQSYCLHHEDRYNPWHRVYLKIFEDALRSVPGCEEVTLPYWDTSTAVPDVLKQAPFDSYVVVPNLGPNYGPNYRTQRYDQAGIDANLARYQFFKHMASALKQSLWGVYGINGLQDEFIAAHDGGHLSIGPTMADQNVSSYDPIFWFYHCNLDRLWLRWQINDKATTLAGFTTTLNGNTAWLSAPFNDLPPFATTADQTIAFNIFYEEAAMPVALTLMNRVGSLDAARRFRIAEVAMVSIMVKNINRLNIPGSFAVNLLADGEVVESRAFFQPNKPQDCATCRKLGLINVNFLVEADKVMGRKLSVEIEVPSQANIGQKFPLSGVGNPTINARLLLEEV
jgi:tyrosinase